MVNMNMLIKEKNISDEAAIYQIQVKGKITDILIHSVDDMQVRQDDSAEAVSLVGWLPDQSALLGLLNTLNDIRYAIISVRILTNNY
jgi:hypothetical protein